MALSFNAQAGAGTGVNDGYSGRYRGGDGGKTLTIQPPADDPASRPGRHAGHRATRSLLVTPGQGRSPLPPLDSDALNPGIRAGQRDIAAGAAPIESALKELWFCR